MIIGSAETGVGQGLRQSVARIASYPTGGPLTTSRAESERKLDPSSKFARSSGPIFTAKEHVTGLPSMGDAEVHRHRWLAMLDSRETALHNGPTTGLSADASRFSVHSPLTSGFCILGLPSRDECPERPRDACEM
jgi:hypothetical protein